MGLVSTRKAKNSSENHITLETGYCDPKTYHKHCPLLPAAFVVYDLAVQQRPNGIPISELVSKLHDIDPDWKLWCEKYTACMFRKTTLDNVLHFIEGVKNKYKCHIKIRFKDYSVIPEKE